MILLKKGLSQNPDHILLLCFLTYHVLAFTIPSDIFSIAMTILSSVNQELVLIFSDAFYQN